MYYYDVNSLYPYVMTKPMPGGKPVWRLVRQRYGASIWLLCGSECPDTIKIPLLPYKDPYKGTYFLQGRLQASTLRKS